MKKILFLIFIVSIANAQDVDTSDYAAKISCPYEINRSGDPSGVKYNDREGHHEIVFTNCSDGPKKYALKLYQHKIANLDFLWDKYVTTGYLNLICFGTDVSGVYHGASAGVGFVFGLELGIFISVMGEQSICILGDGSTMDLDSDYLAPIPIGVDVSPLKLDIRIKN